MASSERLGLSSGMLLSSTLAFLLHMEMLSSTDDGDRINKTYCYL